MTKGKPRPGGVLPAGETHSTADSRARSAEQDAVIDGTPFMLARLGRDMRYRFISRAYARMIARRSEDVIGKHVTEVLGEEGFAAVRPHIEKALRGEPTEYELELRFPGLGPRLIRGMYTPVLDEAGRSDGWIASLLDVGEQRRGEQARQQLANIVDSSSDAIFSEDLDGLIVSWNRGAERLYGYAAPEVIGKSIAVLMPPTLSEEETQILARIAQGEHIEHYETVRRCKDGRLIEVSLTVSPVRNAEGKIVGASKIARDITERRQASRALARRAEEQKALYEFTNRLYRADSLAAVYRAALDAIVSALHCSRASILRFDESGVMRFVAWRGLSDRYRRAGGGGGPPAPPPPPPPPGSRAPHARAGLPRRCRRCRYSRRAQRDRGGGRHRRARLHSDRRERQARRQIHGLSRGAARVCGWRDRPRAQPRAAARLRGRAHADGTGAPVGGTGTARAERTAGERSRETHARARPHLERLGRFARRFEFRRLFHQHQSRLDPAARLERAGNQIVARERIAPSGRCRPFHGRARPARTGCADRAHGKPLPPPGRLLALDQLDHDGGKRTHLCCRPPRDRGERGGGRARTGAAAGRAVAEDGGARAIDGRGRARLQ